MIKVSHIVPKGALDYIQGRDFYMCLANIAVKDKEYRDFYKKQRANGAFILLDNGAAEHDQITMQQILEVAMDINVNELVLSDTLCNCDETISKSIEAIKYYRESGYRGQFMFVPQGDNFNEWKRCFDIMMTNHDISTFGISKFMTSHFNDPKARLKAIQYMESVLPTGHVDVHLLGCHNNIMEISEIVDKQPPHVRVRSTDTAIAYIYSEIGASVLKGDRPCNEIDFINGETKDFWLLKNMFDFDRSVMR